MTIITSFQNPLVKQIKRLQQKKYRQKEGLFFIEGLRVVLTALEQQAPIERLVYCDALLSSDTGRLALQQTAYPTTHLAADIFRQVASRDNPVGLAAIVRTQWPALNDLTIAPTSIFVALGGITDPGNLGTILRTIDAAGGAGLILVGSGTDPFHPTAVKASMGTLFTVPMAATPDFTTLADWAGQNQLQTITTSAKATHVHWQAPFRFPALLLMGSERTGLPAEILHRSDLSVVIPMRGQATSLNLAIATGLLLYECQRRLQGSS